MASDILPFATGGGANVIDQATYAAMATLLANGFSAGIAESEVLNKVWRQSSFMAAGLAGLASDYGQNILDNGNLTNLKGALDAFLTAKINAVGSGFSTGDIKATIKTAADTGWIMCNDQTIGSAASGAGYANAAAQALYTLLWTNVSNTYAPVTGGRGANAAADWAANKPIALTKMLGRALAAGGAGASLTARALGETLGEEAHALTSAENGPHTHPITDPQHSHSFTITQMGGDTTLGNYVDQSAAGTDTSVAFTTAAASTGITVNSSGSGNAHNNMQPTTFVNFMIKL